MGKNALKRVLMIAYHFPPMNASSGIQRTLRFAQYLPELGWEPSILSAHPRAYASVAKGGAADVSPSLLVRRAFALDASRHASVAGRYPQMLGIPDRWSSWLLGAVPAGLAMIRKLKPDVIWSTYPIATAHLVGLALSKLSGLPWVADFRDPMAQDGYPEEPSVHRSFEWIEAKTLARCARAVFTAPGALRHYAERYPNIPRERLAVIENGFDESSFAAAGTGAAIDADDAGSTAFDSTVRAANDVVDANRRIVLVHSGTIYASERDPRPFFGALAQLRASGRITGDTLQIVLRATGDDDFVARLVADHNVADVVTIAPSIPYKAALAEMLTADGLLLLQAANCNFQIPAKLYEYLRAGRPILGLTDPQGDTAATLRRAGIDTIAPLDSRAAIAEGLLRFVDLVRSGRAPVADAAHVAAASRKARTVELADMLGDVVERAAA